MSIAGMETGVADESGKHGAVESQNHALNATSNPPCTSLAKTVVVKRTVRCFTQLDILTNALNILYGTSYTVSPWPRDNPITAAWGRHYYDVADTYTNWDDGLAGGGNDPDDGTWTSTYTPYTNQFTNSPTTGATPVNPVYGYPVNPPHDGVFFMGFPSVTSTTYDGGTETYGPSTGTQFAAVSSEIDYAGIMSTITGALTSSMVTTQLASQSFGGSIERFQFRDYDVVGSPPYDDSLYDFGPDGPLGVPSSAIYCQGTQGIDASLGVGGWQSIVQANGPYALATYYLMYNGGYVFSGTCSFNTCSVGTAVTIPVPDFAITLNGPYTGWNSSKGTYFDMPFGVITFLIDCAGCDSVNTI